MSTNPADLYLRAWKDREPQTPEELAAKRAAYDAAAAFLQQTQADPAQAAAAAEAPATTPSTDRPSMLGGLGRSAAQGVSLGFSDEIAAGLRSLPALLPGSGESYGDAYGRNVEEHRRALREFKEDHPVLSTTAEIGGGVAGALAGGAALRAAGLVGKGAVAGARATRLGRFGRVAREGAITGGVAGTGTAEGGLRERLGGAGSGAAIGAGAGVGLVGAGRLVGSAGRKVLDVTGLRPASGGSVGGRFAHRLRQGTGGLVDVQTAEGRARDLMIKSLGREGVGLDAAEALVATAQPGETLMDLLSRPEVARTVRAQLRQTAGGAAVGGGVGALAGGEDGALVGAGIGAGVGAATSRARLTGNALQRLGRAVESIPSEGASRVRKTLQERAAAAPTWIKQGLQRESGLSFEDAVMTAGELAAKRQANAAPLYQQAYQQTVDVSADLADALGATPFRKAYERGRRIAALEGVELPAIDDALAARGQTAAVELGERAVQVHLPGGGIGSGRESLVTTQAREALEAFQRELGERYSQVDMMTRGAEVVLSPGDWRRLTGLQDALDGSLATDRQRIIASVQGGPAEASATPALPVQAIDYMKRRLDDVIEGRMRSGKMGRTEARVLRNRLREVLSEVDEQVPEYAAARAQFAGDAAVEEAFEAGRSGSRSLGLKGFLQEDPRRVAKALEGMSPSEQEFYRRGALDAVREKLEKSADGRDLTKILDGNTEMRARLRLLFKDDDSYRQFVDRVLEPRKRMAGTEMFVLGGSPTARIQQEQGDLAAASLEPIARVATGGVRQIGPMLLNNAFTSRMRGVTEATADALGGRLTAGAGGQAELTAVLQELREHLAAQAAAREARRRLLAPGAAAGTVLFSASAGPSGQRPSGRAGGQ